MRTDWDVPNNGFGIMTASEGPDFICVGMPRAGTGWLYDQLKHHPDFWLPPVKELDYLYPRKPPLLNVRRAHERGKTRPRRERRKSGPRRTNWEDRDFAFLDDAVVLAKQKRDIARYAALFRHKGAQKSGDITPRYSLLTPDVIAEIAEKLPYLKVIYLIRDPVARAWSHINLFHINEIFDTALLEDAGAFASFVDDHPWLLPHSRATQTLENWKAAAPSIPFRHFLFDDIAREPERTRREILEFLDADPGKASAHLPAGFNRKSGNAALAMPDAIRDVLRDRLAGEVRACAALLGGAAGNWPALYGL